MKVTLTHGDKTVELDLTAEQMEQLGLKEEKKKTGYEKAEGVRARIFYESEIGAVMTDPVGPLGCSFFVNHNDYYRAGNYYSHPQVAENNVRADTLMRKLRRYAAEHGGIPSVEDWKDSRLRKYQIWFNHSDGIDINIQPCSYTISQIYGTVYFKDCEACKAAIKEFRDELMWYFTEYQAMLY